MSFLMFLASSQTGNAMETTVVAVQFLHTPSTQHLGGKKEWQIN